MKPTGIAGSLWLRFAASDLPVLFGKGLVKMKLKLRYLKTFVMIIAISISISTAYPNGIKASSRNESQDYDAKLKSLHQDLKSSKKPKRLLWDYLACPYQPLRNEAASILVGMNDPKILKYLISEISNKESNFCSISNECAFIGREDFASFYPYFREIDGCDPLTANNAIMLLAQMGNAAEDALVKLAVNESTFVKERACYCMGLIKSKKFINPLFQLAGDPHKCVSSTAIWALSQIPSAKTDSFFNRIKRMQDRNAIKRGSAYFIRKGDIDLVAVMISILETEGDLGMARNFFSSGKDELVEAAQQWAVSNNCDMKFLTEYKKGPEWNEWNK